MLKNRSLAIPMTNIASSTLTTSYQAINTGGLPNPCYEVWINNASSASVTISLDGVNDHFFLLTDTVLPLPSINNSSQQNFSKFAVGTIFYAKGTAGTGNIYLSGLYQPAQTAQTTQNS